MHLWLRLGALVGLAACFTYAGEPATQVELRPSKRLAAGIEPAASCPSRRSTD
jgi:hypothetical protein